FRSWSAQAEHDRIDRFCGALRENGFALPVIYFSEWLDRWLMGDVVPGLATVEGRRYQAACLSAEQAIACADQCSHQFPEQEWFAARLREAAEGWLSVVEHYVVVIVREVIGPSMTDEEMRPSLKTIPSWLTLEEKPAEPGDESDR